MMTVGQALIASLVERGVEVVFGIPGVHTIELYRGLAGSSIRHVTARHEQGAAFMADGYARVSGKPGVALVITGPGVTNALTAMAQARADSVPMLVVSGVNRKASLKRGYGHLHELPDQSALVGALCPSFMVRSPQELEPALDAAFDAMLGGRPGPAHIEVPLDVMPLPAAPTHRAVKSTLRLIEGQTGNTAGIDAAVALLSTAKQPVILAGGGAKKAGGVLRHLAERLDAPVVETVNARGLMAGHPLEVPASPSLHAVRDLLNSADQVLALGTEFGPTDYDMYQRGPLLEFNSLIRVDLCREQLYRQMAQVRIQGDVAEVATTLLSRLGTHQGDGVARAAAVRQAAQAELTDEMRAQLSCLEAMRDALPGAVFVGDSTQPVYAGNLYYAHDRAAGWFNAATGYGALGFAPGAAVGAALAAPGVPVICLIGDGGLQFSPGELRTAVDECLPIRFVVWNNAGFGEIAQAMREAGTQVIGCAPSPLNLQPFAAACDLPFTQVAPDPAALAAALRAPSIGPQLIEIKVS